MSRRMVVICSLSLVPLLAGACGRGGASTTPISNELPINFDFSNCEGFLTGTSLGTKLSCANGQYHVVVMGRPEHAFPVRLTRPVGALTASTDLRVVHAPADSFYGVMCMASGFRMPAQEWLFVVSLAHGEAFILRHDETNPVLAKRHYLAPVAHAPIEPGQVTTRGMTRVTGTCKPLADGKTRLELSVNGTPTVRWFPKTVWTHFTGSGLYIFTTGPSDLRFDNFTVSAPTHG